MCWGIFFDCTGQPKAVIVITNCLEDRMKKIIKLCLLFSHILLQATPFDLTQEQLTELGNKIWQNECNKSEKKIVWWNKGEPCASLGIGHFLWFPRTKSKKFTETFPSLVAFLIEKKAIVPEWLATKPQQPCPWKSYEDFVQHSTSTQAQELRTLLTKTVALQAEFILQRAEKALPSIIRLTAEEKRAHVKQQFHRMTSSTRGIYALVDYINFKGEGINPKEQYAGHGWGLRHILQQMNGTEMGADALKEFAHMAKKVLEQRVAHAPDQKMEVSHLNGWKNRIDAY